MDKNRKYLSLVCTECNSEYAQQERLYKKAKWKDRCKKCRKDTSTTSCIDCNKNICKNHKRCKVCSNKHRTKPSKLCVDCGKTLSYKAKSRCIKCHNSNQDKGLSKERAKFQNSKKWKITRIECFKRDNYTCTVCGIRGGLVLNAHHIKSYKDHPSLRLDIQNLLTVCEDCHKYIHFHKHTEV